ncbi:MAG: Rieske 2Fe-2S domain-containing protein [Sphingomonadaceae bacterium]|nr:Rieske 2Fe-2S domain-containing protein [Sphingomonadaceae bacterium]
MAADRIALERAHALDPRYYRGADTLDVELREILGRHWQIIAGSEQVAETGDVAVREIADVPVIIIRGEDGALSGFTNICRHRAGPVATCDLKGASRLRCAYHGWTYDLDGKLLSAPEMREAEGFDKDAIRLAPIDIQEWSGLVYARFAEGPGFDAMHDGIADYIGDDPFAGMIHRHAIRYEVVCNWKIYVDNFLEGYHLPYVHPGLNAIVDYSEYTTELGEFWSVQRAPMGENSGAYAAGEAFYFFIYPCTMLNVMPGRLQTNRVVPQGEDRCLVEFDFYYAPGAERRLAEDIAFSDSVQEEDRTICEHVQKALVSGCYEAGRLSPKREAGVWHWQQLLAAAYDEAGR